MKFSFAKFLKEPFFSPKRFVCIKAGRRTGKTYNAVQWLLINLLANGNKAGLWVDTKQGNLHNYIDRYFRKIIKTIWRYCHIDRQKIILTLPNGSYIDFRSAERSELMEGFEYDFVVLNEAGIILKKPAVWYNTIQPMCKNATVRIVGTPKGKNLFHSLYMQGANPDEADWSSYSYTAYDSPYWNTAQLDKLKPSIPKEVWEQEYLAEFLEGAGAVFRNIHACTLPIQDHQPDPNTRYAMGIDIAKHQDFTVIYVADINTKTVVFQDRFNQIDYSFQKERILNIYNKFNKPLTIIDGTGIGDAIYDDLRRSGMNNLESFKFTNSSKADIVNALSLAFENCEIKIMAFPELLHELEIFEYTESSSGLFRYSAPSGMHDDCVMALALVNKGLMSRPPVVRVRFV